MLQSTTKLLHYIFQAQSKVQHQQHLVHTKLYRTLCKCKTAKGHAADELACQKRSQKAEIGQAG